MDDEKSENEIMFPAGVQYKLLAGGTVHVMPWSIETISKVAQRMPALIDRAGSLDKDTPVIEMMPDAIEEVAWLLEQSVEEFEEGDAKKLLADDFLGLSIKVFDECMAGPLGKIAALGVRARAMMAMAGTPSESPSSS